jgi:hypothetical protein
MFEGLTVLFCGGLSTARKKIFSKIFTDNGGNVVSHNAKHIGKRADLDSSLNYIIVENTTISFAKLHKEFKCETFPEGVKVLDCKWIEQCMLSRCLLNPESFEIKYTSEYLATSPVRSEQFVIEGSASLKRSVESETCMANESQDYIMHCASDNEHIAKKARRAYDLSCQTAGIILRYQDKIFMVQVSSSLICAYARV